LCERGVWLSNDITEDSPPQVIVTKATKKPYHGNIMANANKNQQQSIEVLKF
jgi:hypothetical protein